LSRYGSPTITAETLEQYLNEISSQSQIFKFSGTLSQKLQQAQDILEQTNRVNTEPQLKAQLLALWLNQAADYSTNYQIEGKYAQQIIQSTENAIKNRQTRNYGYWQELCEQFNNLT
jgi:hypothetical protein